MDCIKCPYKYPGCVPSCTDRRETAEEENFALAYSLSHPTDFSNILRVTDSVTGEILWERDSQPSASLEKTA